MNVQKHVILCAIPSPILPEARGCPKQRRLMYLTSVGDKKQENPKSDSTNRIGLCLPNSDQFALFCTFVWAIDQRKRE